MEHTPATASLVCKGHTGGVLAVASNLDTSVLVSGSGDRTARVWDGRTGECLHVLQHSNYVYGVCKAAHSDNVYTCCGDAALRVWRQGTCTSTLQGHTGAVLCLASDLPNSLLFSGSKDKTVRIWSVESMKSMAVMEGHPATVTSVSCTPDGTSLLSAGGDESSIMWDTATGKSARVLRDKRFNVPLAVSLGADGGAAVSGNANGSLTFWDPRAATCVAATVKAHDHWVSAVALGSDGRTLVSASFDGRLLMWDLGTRRAVASWDVNGGCVLAVTLSADSRKVIAGYADKTLRVMPVQEAVPLLNAVEGELSDVAAGGGGGGS